MVMAGCQWARPADADPFFFEVEEDYRAVGYPGDAPPEPDEIGPWHFPREALGFFEQLAVGRYPFQVTYGVEDFLANLGTQSGTRHLVRTGHASSLRACILVCWRWADRS
jgi:hypothetical protein